MSILYRHDHGRCGGAHEHHAHAEHGAAARPFAFANSPRHFERDRPFAIEHLALDLALDFVKKSIRGAASLRIRRVDPDARRIELDAIAFTVDAVTIDGKDARYTYDGRRMSVDVPSALATGVLVIAYSATPRKGLYFLEPDEHVMTRPRQAWTQCQEEDARHIFPCHDKPHVKMTTETRVRVPKGFSVLSNGELASRETADDGFETFHWKMNEPHPSYLMTIVAGEFAVFGDKVKVGSGEEAREVPLTYLVPRGREADGRRTFGRTPEMVTYFSELTGVAYPWNKYAQVVVSDFIFGGMENTTATTMYEHILLDERAAIDVTSDDLIAHELAHQWFGDYVTCRDWSEGWLNEGFATFMEHVWREKHLGRDEYEYGIKNDLSSYLGEAHGRYRRAVVCQDYDAPLDLFDRHLYEKGGLALHVLRTELGDALFWKGVSLYLHRHARSVVETRDLLRALEEVSGRSLGRRFEELVYKPGHPEVEVDLSWDDGVLACSLKQTQSTHDGVPGAFEVPLVLAISFDDDASVRREKIRLASRSDVVAIPCKERPRFVVVDPDMRVVGDVTVKAPPDMLRRQLAEGPTARSRWLAAQALAKSDDPVTIQALARRLADDQEFWGVRAECADALGRIRAQECFEALVGSLGVRHAKVRRAVVEALGRFRTTAAAQALKPKALRDESYLVEAEAARALGKTRQSTAFEVLLDVMDRPSWAEVIPAAAIDGLAALRDDRALPHLFARTRYGHPSRVRRAAALAIPKLATDRRAREHLEDLLDDGDPILRIDVVRALADLADGRSRGALRARAEVDLDPRVRRRIREVVRDLGGDKKLSDQLKDDVEKLQNELADAKARLSKLEARIPGNASEQKSKPGLGASTAKPGPKKPAPPTKKK
ncbi:MAG: HEAT repeat domain-containing protein [Deltaproteobacteria bacterium]|nr:HEAT repeat domain-containing protein [Deltaproteobacteria bacterium]